MNGGLVVQVLIVQMDRNPTNVVGCIQEPIDCEPEDGYEVTTDFH